MKPNLPLYEFGQFSLDTADRLLMRANQMVSLTPKALDVLCVLVENYGRLVEKEELMQQCWPHTIVEEANLPQAICVLRKALGKGGRGSQYIQTVCRRGYRFNVAVTAKDRSLGNTFPTNQKSVDTTEINSEFETSAAEELGERPGSDLTEAQHLYMRGRYFWAKYTVDGLKKGIEYFQAAIESDSNLPLPYTGLADCYYRLANIHLRTHLAIPKSKASVLKALELDDTLAEAHTLLGLINWFYDRDWPAAEPEFQRAIAMAPKCAIVHKRYGWALGMRGSFDAATREINHALKLDPRSADLHVALGIVLHLTRRFEAALLQAQVALDIEPDYHPAQTLLGIANIQKLRLTEGITALEKAVAIANVARNRGYLGYGYAIAGQRKRALKIAAELEQRPVVSSFSIALVYAGLGDNEQALRALQRMNDNPNELLGFVKCSPELDNLRRDPRFTGILERGLPVE